VIIHTSRIISAAKILFLFEIAKYDADNLVMSYVIVIFA
jgi:hypothetical protein